MTAWLHIVGIGEDGVDGLSPKARAAVQNADYIVGGKRHHALIGDVSAERINWPSPFDALISQLQSLRGENVVVLATGDPLWFSVGNNIVAAFDMAEVQFHAHVGAFQLAAAQMGWALQDVDCLSVHGRPIERIKPLLQNGRKLLLLTSNGAAVSEIAAFLEEAGFGDSQLTALSHLGGADQTRFEGNAMNWAHKVPDLNTLAIECIADAVEHIMPQGSGLPDDAFEHDGTMTKQEVRAITLAKLMPMPNALLWDVGCGCGSVAVEWMRSARNARAIGIETRADRRAFAKANALNLGGFDLPLIDQPVPDALNDLEAPDAIFVGGGLSAETFEACLVALKPMGRLVCNAVTLGSEQVLLDKHAEHGGELSRLQFSRAIPVGNKMGWKPAMPVTQYSLVKR
ncbi:precorrin-6y C5,15-methyltransferase (decarboxylating) subunit CbiE [Amylibacter sp. SFDW26]|uniref:precorrin-6y C5,15-methyltransferase (decarboxylating) subunit CbiE n=1 Tax=Amylibacter sp. SFDW26 TaxID=2652722 RepID=UPI0012619E19|nr:precorrin-6y C5,15-methyltransferase (decarboxylating) subunit CbiE [Amylibacter sp. SFDW26]KAB7614745.1 precorrin-6y C5,15-methyltransferase (decarboxylating) subunit CbiE [Amylibacter sp. SFDW26]